MGLNTAESINTSESGSASRCPYLPFDSNFIEIAGHKMHYIDEGSGPVVVLLHGNPTWSYYYRNLITQLTPYFRCIAPDHIGCGLSDHPENVHFRARDRIEHCKELLKKLGITKFSLIMHDWGGPIGTGVALDCLSSIEKLVYFNTTLTEIESLPKIIRQAARPIIGKYITKTSLRFLKLTTEFGVVNRLPQKVKDGYLYPYLTSARRTAIWDFVADIPFDSSHPTYQELFELASRLYMLQEKPVQIIWGLQDPCFHREMLGKVSQHFPQAKVLEIPEASHLVLEDAPELCNKTVLDFLQAPALHKGEASDKAPAVIESALYKAFSEIAIERAVDDALILGEFRGTTGKYSHIKYSELQRLVNTYQRGLTKLGLLTGDKVLMLVPVGMDFLAFALAVMGRGAIPVFVDPGVGKDNLKRVISDLSPDVFISVPKGQLLRVFLRKAFKRLKFGLTVSDWAIIGKHTSPFLKKFSAAPLPPVHSTGTAFIAFTSGATGTPKGVVFSDEMIRGQLKIFTETLGLEAGNKDMPLLPIFSLFNVALGVTTVLPPMDASRPLSLDPYQVTRMCQDLNVTYSFGSPTLWGKISEYALRSGITLNSIKKVFIAGAPVPDKVLEQVERIISNGEVYTPYGATEALPVSLISGKERLNTKDFSAKTGEIGVNIGRPISGATVKVIKEVHGRIDSAEEMVELQQGEIGEIVVKGSHVSKLYYNRPEANKVGKIPDGDSFWHRMGDVGYFSSSGELFFCGRRNHVVRIGTDTWYSVPVEKIFNQHPKVRRSALVSIGNSDEVAIVVEPQSGFMPLTDEAVKEFKDELRKLAISTEITRQITLFFFHPSFPVDARHNAKIFRDKLGTWATTILREKNV